MMYVFIMDILFIINSDHEIKYSWIIPINTSRWFNVGLMLDQLLQRLSNFAAAVANPHVFPGNYCHFC